MRTPSEFLAEQMTFLVPLLLIWIVGIILAVARGPHHFRSCALAAVALSMMIGVSVLAAPVWYLGYYTDFLRDVYQRPGVDPAVYDEYLRSISGHIVVDLGQRGWDFSQLSRALIPISEILRGIALAMLVFAVFSWRETASRKEALSSPGTVPNAKSSDATVNIANGEG